MPVAIRMDENELKLPGSVPARRRGTAGIG
jgi:hypothetical protein